jgi:DNA-directed RNA polymerase subunit beta
MYAYIDRKKKLPVTTLFRAIGFEQKISLRFSTLLKKLKFLKQDKNIGKLAARVLTHFEGL